MNGSRALRQRQWLGTCRATRTRRGPTSRCPTAGPRAASPPGSAGTARRSRCTCRHQLPAYRRADRRPRAWRGNGGLPGVHLRERLAHRPVREQRGTAHRSYVPAGVLKDDGSNTLAIAVWGLDLRQAAVLTRCQTRGGGRPGGRCADQRRSPDPGYQSGRLRCADRAGSRRWPPCRRLRFPRPPSLSRRRCAIPRAPPLARRCATPRSR